MYPFGPGGCAHKKHTDNIGIGSIRICIGARSEPSDFGRANQAQVFLFDNKYIPIGHQQQIDYFFRDPQPVHRMITLLASFIGLLIVIRVESYYEGLPSFWVIDPIFLYNNAANVDVKAEGHGPKKI